MSRYLFVVVLLVQDFNIVSSATIASTSSSSSVTTTTTSSPTPSTITYSTNLSCYDCSETFKYLWEPYTQCQYYPTSAPLRPCLATDRYCKVERVTYKSMTVSIARGCTNECWHGCYASGFGLTKLKCTSCCPTSGCNTGNFASQTHPSCWIVLSLMFTSACITSGIVFQ